MASLTTIWLEISSNKWDKSEEASKFIRLGGFQLWQCDPSFLASHNFDESVDDGWKSTNPLGLHKDLEVITAVV